MRAVRFVQQVEALGDMSDPMIIIIIIIAFPEFSSASVQPSSVIV
jgi:hypothetical protein